jgi:hypothetical protein
MFRDPFVPDHLQVQRWTMTFMKIALKKRSLLRKILLMLVCAVMVTIAYFELGHRYLDVQPHSLWLRLEELEAKQPLASLRPAHLRPLLPRSSFP